MDSLENDPRMPLHMQQVRLDRDGIPHNVGWMPAATDDQLTRETQRAQDAWQSLPARYGDRELWWLDRLDDEDKRRSGWSDDALRRYDRQITTRRQREADNSPSGRLYRAFYRLRDRTEERRNRRDDPWRRRNDGRQR